MHFYRRWRSITLIRCAFAAAALCIAAVGNSAPPHPLGFLYVPVTENNAMLQYCIGPDGRLSALSPPFVACRSGLRPYAHPSGHFLYVPLLSGGVAQFRILEDGSLQKLTPSIAPTGEEPWLIVVSKDGLFAYVLNNGAATISQFRVTADGVLAPLQTPLAVAPPAPMDIALTGDGRFAYVAGRDGQLWEYSVGPEGALKRLPGAAVQTGAINGSHIRLSSDSQFVYLTAWGGNIVAAPVLPYHIGEDGRLQALPRVTAGAAPLSPYFHPSGHYMYIFDIRDNHLYQYRVAEDGSLHPLIPPVVAMPWKYLYGWPLVFTPKGEFAYSVQAESESDPGFIYQFKVDPGGTLRPLSPPRVETGQYPRDMTMDPAGHYVYVINLAYSTISQYQIAANGALKPLMPPTIRCGGALEVFKLVPWHDVKSNATGPEPAQSPPQRKP